MWRGGGSDSHAPGSTQYGFIRTTIDELSPSVVRITITNTSRQYPTGQIGHNFDERQNDLELYDPAHPNLWCDHNICPKACTGNPIPANDYCYAYINAKNSTGYFQGNQRHNITITNNAESHKLFNFSMTNAGVLYALNAMGEVKYRANTPADNRWETIPKPLGSGNITALDTDRYGVVYIGDDHGHVYRFDPTTSNWNDLGVTNPAVNAVLTLAFGRGNELYSAGRGSGQIYEYINGNWQLNAPRLVIPGINHISHIGHNERNIVFVVGERADGTTGVFQVPVQPNFNARPMGFPNTAILGFGYNKTSGDLLVSFQANNDVYEYTGDQWLQAPGIVGHRITDFTIDNDINRIATHGLVGQLLQYNYHGYTWDEFMRTGFEIRKLTQGSKLTITPNNP